MICGLFYRGDRDLRGELVRFRLKIQFIHVSQSSAGSVFIEAGTTAMDQLVTRPGELINRSKEKTQKHIYLRCSLRIASTSGKRM